MKIVKVACKVSGIGISSTRPSFKYSFGKVGESIEMPESHAKKILRNSDFYISGKLVKKERKTSQGKSQRPQTKELEETH